MAWCEQLFRAGPVALLPCPLLRLAAGAGPAELLDLVPTVLVDQLVELGTLADTKLLGAFPPPRSARLGCPLGRRPIAADADLVLGNVLLELKCTQGASRAAGRTFALGVDLVRQLLGYLLLDQDDELAARAVGVYAARFGLLWTMPADELIGFWTLLDEDRVLLAGRRGATALGFAVLLTYYSRFGRFPCGRSEVADEVIAFIAGQLGVDASDLGSTSGRAARSSITAPRSGIIWVTGSPPSPTRTS